MIIRKATLADVEAAHKIYESAKEFMHSSGNPNQWTGEYPSGSDVKSGIANGTSYVCVDGDEVVATFYFGIGDDPTYKVIYDGEWKNALPYAVVHRIAVKHRGKGILGFVLDECFKMYSNLKIDTHRDNIPMQRALKKSGFEYCGIIHLANGDERLAYQRIC